jgi:hypothetical protein
VSISKYNPEKIVFQPSRQASQQVEEFFFTQLELIRPIEAGLGTAFSITS